MMNSSLMMMDFVLQMMDFVFETAWSPQSRHFSREESSFSIEESSFVYQNVREFPVQVIDLREYNKVNGNTCRSLIEQIQPKLDLSLGGRQSSRNRSTPNDELCAREACSMVEFVRSGAQGRSQRHQFSRRLFVVNSSF